MSEAEQSALRARNAWLESGESGIGIHDDDGRGYLYVQHEVLTTARELPRLTDGLRRLQIDVKHDGPNELGVIRVRLEGGTPDLPTQRVPSVLDQLRKITSDANQLPLNVAPNHVLSGEPEYAGGPATAARPSATKTSVSGRHGKGVRVTVVDTGYTRGVHPYMDSRISSTGTPELDSQPKDGQIDYEAGHSTFVAGMILRKAPRASVDIVEVLGPAGFGTEHDIAEAILTHASANVINLSLGGYTENDVAPLALDAALRRVRPGTAVVAAAGNNSSSRLMWPAAFKRVIAVGAVDHEGQRAAFSNYGWWVDGCTPGVEIVGPFPRFPQEEKEAPALFDGWAIWSGTSFAAPKVAGEIAARLSTRRFATARDAASSLVDDPTRPRVPDLGTLLVL